VAIERQEDGVQIFRYFDSLFSLLIANQARRQTRFGKNRTLERKDNLAKRSNAEAKCRWDGLWIVDMRHTPSLLVVPDFATRNFCPSRPGDPHYNDDNSRRWLLW
jgi:mRNA deadenylase 3'-5' endonuclease subunit Ccr4